MVQLLLSASLFIWIPKRTRTQVRTHMLVHVTQMHAHTCTCKRARECTRTSVGCICHPTPPLSFFRGDRHRLKSKDVLVRVHVCRTVNHVAVGNMSHGQANNAIVAGGNVVRIGIVRRQGGVILSQAMADTLSGLGAASAAAAAASSAPRRVDTDPVDTGATRAIAAAAPANALPAVVAAPELPVGVPSSVAGSDSPSLPIAEGAPGEKWV